MEEGGLYVAGPPPRASPPADREPRFYRSLRCRGDGNLYFNWRNDECARGKYWSDVAEATPCARAICNAGGVYEQNSSG
jgi:hypothetical protein